MPVEKYKHRDKITKGVSDLYAYFKKKYRLKHFNIPETKHNKILYDINKLLSEQIIKESLELKLPGGLGTLSIVKRKVKIYVKDGKLKRNRMIVDWKKSWDIWLQDYPGLTRKEIMAIPNKTVIYNLNDHTNGYVMSWFWDKRLCKLHNRCVYTFKPVKKNRLDLAEWINSPDRENDYFLNDNSVVYNKFKIYKEQQEKDQQNG